MNREIDAWVAGKPVERIVPVLTAGVIAWDADARDFTESSTCGAMETSFRLSDWVPSAQLCPYCAYAISL